MAACCEVRHPLTAVLPHRLCGPCCARDAHGHRPGASSTETCTLYAKLARHRAPQPAQGRDSQRNLQRSIAARKVRDGLPALVASLAAAADLWAADEGGPFTLDGRDLKARSQQLPCQLSGDL